jgi:hypothetical protein
MRKQNSKNGIQIQLSLLVVRKEGDSTSSSIKEMLKACKTKVKGTPWEIQEVWFWHL